MTFLIGKVENQSRRQRPKSTPILHEEEARALSFILIGHMLRLVNLQRNNNLNSKEFHILALYQNQLSCGGKEAKINTAGKWLIILQKIQILEKVIVVWRVTFTNIGCQGEFTSTRLWENVFNKYIVHLRLIGSWSLRLDCHILRALKPPWVPLAESGKIQNT